MIFSGDYDAALRALFDPGHRKAGHNIKNIQKALLNLGVELNGWVFDTALAAYLLDATAGSYEIRSLCVKYCGFEPWRAETGEIRCPCWMPARMTLPSWASS